MDTLEDVSWVLRWIGFGVVAFLVLPALWVEFKKDENGMRFDRYAMMFFLNTYLVLTTVAPTWVWGWITTQMALIINGVGLFCVAMAFFTIAYRYRIRDILKRWFH